MCNTDYYYIIILFHMLSMHFKFLFMPQYSWNTAKVGIKHQPTNQSINMIIKKILIRVVPDHMVMKFVSSSLVLVLEKHPIRTSHPINVTFWLDYFDWVLVISTTYRKLSSFTFSAISFKYILCVSISATSKMDSYILRYNNMTGRTF